MNIIFAHWMSWNASSPSEESQMPLFLLKVFPQLLKSYSVYVGQGQTALTFFWRMPSSLSEAVASEVCNFFPSVSVGKDIFLCLYECHFCSVLLERCFCLHVLQTCTDACPVLVPRCSADTFAFRSSSAVLCWSSLWSRIN